MKKLLFIFVAFACATSSWGAVNVKTTGVKKAAPVATKQTDKMETATSLLPTVVGLVANVKALSVQQQQLTADCAPTSSEIETVNNLVKEWAKTGTVTASVAESGLGSYCGPEQKKNSSGYYHNYMEYADKNESCYENFSATDDEGTIWYLFPKASKTEICDSVSKKNCKNISNIYDIFARIPFSEEDYT